MTNKAEQIKRLAARVNATDKAVSAVDRELFNLYQQASASIEKEISGMVGRYAAGEGLSRTKASALLGGREHSVWRMSIDKYVQQSGDSAILRELNTLAMKSRISRHEALLGDIYGHMITLAQDSETTIGNLLSNLIPDRYYRTAFDLQRGMGIATNIARVDERTVRHILTRNWDGNKFSKDIWGNTDKLASAVRRELALGEIRGDSVQQMASAINKNLGAGYNNAKRVVITESSRVTNRAEISSFAQLGYTRYTYMSGSASTDYCLELNNKTFRLDEAVEGTNLPPLHPNCKCTVTASNEGFYDGGNSMPFPDGMTFEEWQQKFTL